MSKVKPVVKRKVAVTQKKRKAKAPIVSERKDKALLHIQQSIKLTT